MIYPAQIVEIVEIVEAVKRIPGKLERVSFFSHEDMWIFDAKEDSTTCGLCNAFDATFDFPGDLLRSTFPYLEVVDANTIAANIHPNCRCRLRRVVEVEIGETVYRIVKT